MVRRPEDKQARALELHGDLAAAWEDFCVDVLSEGDGFTYKGRGMFIKQAGDLALDQAKKFAEDL